MLNVLSQDINKLEGFFLYVHVFFSFKQQLFICINSCEQCQFSTLTLYISTVSELRMH